MATGSDDINKVKKQLEDLKKNLDDVASKKLDSIIASLTSGGASLEDWNEQLSKFQDMADTVSNSLLSISQRIKDSVNEVSRGNVYLSQFNSISNKIAKTAAQNASVRKGETSINEKSLKAAKEQIESQKRQLKISQLNLGVFSKEGLEVKAVIDTLDDYEKSLEKVLKTNTEINKSLGAIPQLAGGIDKAFQKLGLPNLGMSEALDETRKLGQIAADNGEKFNAIGTFTSHIKTNLKDMVTPANLIQAGMGFMVAALIKGDKATGDLAKGMNLSYSEANKLRGELTTIAAASGDAALNTRGLQETLMHVGSQLGSNAKLNSADLITYTKLREQAGYTNEELYGVQQLSLVNGKSLEKNTKEILGGAKAYSARNKLMLNEKQILKDVSSASASLKLTLGGSADKLAEAAAKARQFGVSLQQAESISSSLLNFESSIENELSAELLTGKDLNFERARGLALNGQTADAAAEIAKQVGTSADFAKMNVIQQEAIAKAAGMERNELAQSLMDREAMVQLAGVEGNTAKERFNNLVKEVGLTEAKKRLGDEGLANQFAQQSVQERMAQSMEKLQEIFVALAEPVLAFVSPIMDMVSALTGLAGGALPTIFKIMGGIYLLSKATAAWELLKLGYAKSKTFFDNLQLGILIAKEAKEKGGLGLAAARALMDKQELATKIGIAAATSIINPVAAIAGIALAGIAAAAIYSSMKVGDMSSKADGKTQVSTKEGGLFELSPNDDFAAAPGLVDRLNNPGTDLIGNNKKPTSSGGGSSDASLISEMRSLINEFRNSNNKSINVAVNVDGKQVATAAGNNSKEFYDSSRKGNHKVQ